MMAASAYPIGSPGVPWGDHEKAQWRAAQSRRRDYRDEVQGPLEALTASFALTCYGELDYPEGRYPLLALTSRDWLEDRPSVLITGGVHGYETSGVQGAIRFLQTRAADYVDRFNLAIAPCISPWGYETINRWNPMARDPNRHFVTNSPVPEAALVMAWVDSLAGEFIAHFDLHETTDSDNNEFRPALGARDGVEQAVWDIPDGFYLVADSAAPAPAFQQAIIAAVARVTHIAPADAEGRIIGEPTTQQGVIHYDVARLGLCAGMTAAPYRTTTEVYPDSPRVDADNCNDAQVAAVCGGLDYLTHLDH